jgi:hypothetical protein
VRRAARAIVRPVEWEQVALLALERAGRTPVEIQRVRIALGRDQS